MLVTGENSLQLFMGWEGVGLASYLLIHFWFTRLQADKAATKAMPVNRVGDFGLAPGISSHRIAYLVTRASPGIDLYHFRRNDIKVLTFSLVSRSGALSSFALRPRLFVKWPQSFVFKLLKNSCSSYSANSGSFEEDLDLKREIKTLLDLFISF
ncbi:hypothetical protein G4B88_000655 [Cannabis sativa]|uniref:NADH:quinone oxidoreductase/Mrp antiporter transmembrane domain-containing protein n=1 Tax=Cannabis sativa TaxID=3483 RepID=A0A7J6HFV1_CANSA|nr:hypothetical protein G4B88_000655 [Cannabis sativa]